MILSFKQKFDSGNPTYFVEKIWSGFINDSTTHESLTFCDYYDEVLEKLDTNSELILRATPKLHTIREDRTNRWKAGNDIHLYNGPYTSKGRFQFAPVVKCISVQKIEILAKDWRVKINDHHILPGTLHRLAINDGFDSVEDFFEYFNKDFTGKIIHWTDLKY
jgi:hypothetical protein